MIPPLFERVREGRLDVLVRPSLRADLLPILRDACRGWSATRVSELPGGRGATVVVATASGRFVVRAGRRGGLPGRVLSDLYVGFSPRPFAEAVAVEQLRARGAPLAEACAAAVEWVGPALYRSWLLTRWIEGARTLWDWAQRERNEPRRQEVLRAVGRAVRQLHEAGARHPDLNATNVLVCLGMGTDDHSVVLIDLDGVQISPRAVVGQRDLDRLRRSARKLDPSGAALSDADLGAIDFGYRGR